MIITALEDFTHRFSKLITSFNVQDNTTIPNECYVLFSGMSYTRNSMLYVYPCRMDRKLYRQFFAQADAVIGRITQQEFTEFSIASMSMHTKYYFEEARLLPFSVSDHARLYCNKTQDISILLNHHDHVLISTQSFGFNLEDLYQSLEIIDGVFEDNFHYAVSMELGYLSSDIANIGTAFRMYALIHLPFISRATNKSMILQDICDMGYAIDEYRMHATYGSDIFLMSNSHRIGESEKQMRDNMNDAMQQLCAQEAKLEQHLLHDNEVIVKDAVLRAWALLNYAYMLSHDEAKEYISLVRLGMYLDILVIPTHIYLVLDALFFICQTYHVCEFYYKEYQRYPVTMDDENMFRSCLIQQLLQKYL